MTLKKIQITPGVNRENTRYTNEGKWYESDKVRFRQGTPQKMGDWERIGTGSFIGICRALWDWVTLGGLSLLAVATESKIYLQDRTVYKDITPLRKTNTNIAVFAASNGSSTVTVTDAGHGGSTGYYVTFSGAVSLGGNVTATVLNTNYYMTVVDANTYTITVAVTANASDTGNGGATVVAKYDIAPGSATALPTLGWGAGAWGLGTWGVGTGSTTVIRTWSMSNFGEDLILCYRNGPLYLWDASAGITSRAGLVSAVGGATDVPTVALGVMVASATRFVFAFGCNDYLSATQDPLLVRWASQESAINWTVDATTTAGSLRLAQGSTIVAWATARQEVLVFTDTALFSVQYLGAPAVWGQNLLSSATTCISQKAVAVAAGVTYWMGLDKFYKYDGHVQTLNCDLRQYVFSDINLVQVDQIFSGTLEAFNEVWWFYPSEASTTVDRYVVYNYMENIWYYGTMARTAWIDSGVNTHPTAATYLNNTVYHEVGVDDNASGTPAAIEAYILSGEFDIDDGDSFMFIRRVLPDVSFTGSTAPTPAMTFTLKPMRNSGSGYTDPESTGSTNTATVTRTATVPIEAYTGQANVMGQAYIRVRGRQMALEYRSTGIGVQWQAGSLRVDMRPDGRR